jgi:hypothetical protein
VRICGFQPGKNAEERLQVPVVRESLAGINLNLLGAIFNIIVLAIAFAVLCSKAISE